jgi:hypothetical protein
MFQRDLRLLSLQGGDGLWQNVLSHFQSDVISVALNNVKSS